ncbi:hypothetical protein CPB85DRAFT_909629 [Mucidula mucida]|nr:hypothetical protein CPB85DRAFT_909629 [Mucidula mucida]
MSTPLDNTAPQCPTCAFLSLQPNDPALTRTARVEELLRRNHPPLEAALADFRFVVEKAPDIIHDLDQKLAKAKELVDLLVRARAQADSHLADAKSLLHPMRSLPNEFLGEIFSHCVWTWDTADGTQQIDALAPSSTLWTLIHVCRRWRQLALALPHLWTYIELDFDMFPQDITPRQLAFKMALLIERSKGLPLFIFITATTDIEDHSIILILEASIPR